MCTWYKHESDGFKCVPHSRKQCQLYSSIRPKIKNDEYTLDYFDSYACKMPCISYTTKLGCLTNEDEGCQWISDRSSFTSGHCRGATAYTYIHKLISDGQPIKREAMYSYTISAYDCRVMCETTALSYTKGRCSSVKYCCKEDSNGSCTVDFMNIANRFSPVMQPIAHLEMLCRSKDSQAECEGDLRQV